MEKDHVKLFKDMIKLYIKNIDYPPFEKKVSELEVRFGLNDNKSLSKKSISKIDFDNVIKQLRATGFNLENTRGDLEAKDSITEQYYLRMTCHEDLGSNRLKPSNLRLEMRGLDLIQKYCIHNDIQKILDESSDRSKAMIQFTEKTTPLSDPKNSESIVAPVSFDSYNYRVSYKLEEDFPIYSEKSKKEIENWTEKKKTFRFIKRYRFSHHDELVFVDVSILKANQKDKTKSIYIPTYTIQQSFVFESAETYEIEIELNNEKIKKINNGRFDAVLSSLRKTIHTILSGLQHTNYPISYIEQDHVLRNYLNLVYMEKPNPYEGSPISSSDFFGPSSITLQIENLLPKTKDNVLTNYSVTDKADGERKMLYICPSPNGIARLYLIDTNMSVVFTGKTTMNKDLYGTLIDGEHILYDKKGNYINLYAAFDIYFTYQQKEQGQQRESGIMAVRNYPFITKASVPSKKERYSLLKNRIKLLNETSNGGESCSFIVQVKEFYTEPTIFEGCAKVLNNSPYSQYNTDGLIFTPCDLPIPISQSKNKFKVTWDKSFKWKPANYNTIDFYVKTKIDKNGQELIRNRFHDGQDLSNVYLDKPYKIIELRCGVDKQNPLHRNPFISVLNLLKGNIEKKYNEKEDSYTPEKFQPTDPYDPQAYLCYVDLKPDNANNLVMKTSEGEIFDEHMIVEFEYDLKNSYPANPWRWKPLRVRYDKTANLLSGQKEYGNAFHVANNNWHSIHNPITEDTLKTGQDIPIDNPDIYYDNNPDSKSDNTKPLRAFHNIVKKNLINAVSSLNSDKSLIDYAVGKAGDLQKWTNSGLEFVLGVDIFRSNIVNDYDGACVRYLEELDKNKRTSFRAIFITGDSSLPIRSGEAMKSEQEKSIARSIFNSSGEKEDLGKFNKRGENGFQIGSCQFAIHYFFQNQTTLFGFLKNLAECTKLGGYFIGTTYDGQKVFDLLKNKTRGEEIVFSRKKEGKDEPDIIFKMIKKYEQTGFPDDENSLGYTISVFQDSIGKPMDEFLVNFQYFKTWMGKIGFELVSPAEIKGTGLENTGFFETLYDTMMQKLKINPNINEYRVAREMKSDEKIISFLNRYFIFKKVFEIDTKVLFKTIERVEKPELLVQKPQKKMTLKKLSSKITLSHYSPVEDEPDDKEPDDKKVALIVPFREEKLKTGEISEKRTKELAKFTEYMTNYFKDVPSVKIFVIEQSDDGERFNRGKLLNIGFMKAKEEGFNIFVFHDVDLLPSHELKPFYLEKTDSPIHIAHVWKDRYSYNKYFGGVVSFSEKTFETINGFPNNFWGWGGEDDALYHRTKINKYSIVNTEKGSFEDLEKMTFQQKNKYLKDNDYKNNIKQELLEEDKNNWKKNGLSHLDYNVLNVNTSEFVERIQVNIL